MLETEQRQLMGGGRRGWGLGVEPFPIVLVGLEPVEAERGFWERYGEVQRERWTGRQQPQAKRANSQPMPRVAFY
jgi:hypothetical protein